MEVGMINLDLRREDFISQYPPLHLQYKKDVGSIWKLPPLNIYLHIPYCRKKCGFCYYKMIAGRNVPDEYIEAVLKEIELLKHYDVLSKAEVRTLYIGGGTPTLLAPKQLETLINALRDAFDFSKIQEFWC